MNRLSLSTPSRREFLKDVVIASAATAGGMSLIPAAFAAYATPADHIKKLVFTVKPSLAAGGAVVVPTKHLMFLTFPAVSVDGHGAGRAVIELQGCVWKDFHYTSQSSNLPEVDHLELCEIFEVGNSSWAKMFQPAVPASAPVVIAAKQPIGSNKKINAAQNKIDPASPPPPSLRHFIFTFIETTFSCVAKDVRVELRHDSFPETLDYIALRELGD